MSDETTFGDVARQATSTVEQALGDLRVLLAAAEQARNTMKEAMLGAQRTTALSSFDADLLNRFFQKPYVVRPLGAGRYELIVPRFLRLRAGWPVRQSDSYDVFEISRFLHLISPLPEWLASELELGEPSFMGILDGDLLTVTDGDASEVYDRLGGRKHIARREGNHLHLRPASRFEVLRRIIRDEGFLPFAPAPVPDDLKRQAQVARIEGTEEPSFRLRPYQAEAYRHLLDLGAISIFAHPQTGKSYVALQAMAELLGPKLILCPRRTLVEQWRARLDLFLEPAAASEVTVTTYHSARKYFNQEWTLVVFDESHHLPADFAIEAAAALKCAARLGLSATPYREDGHEELIPALCGVPQGGDWPVRPAQLPTVTVWLVRDVKEKLKLARELCDRPVDGKTLLFVQRLDRGQQLADILHVPFVHHKTKRQRETIEAHDTIVASSIADEGLSIPAIRRVIEVDFLYGSRMQAGQRAGRLAHQPEEAEVPGEHHVLMDRTEFERYNKRLLVYERWGLQLTVNVFQGGERPGTVITGSHPGRQQSYRSASSARQPTARQRRSSGRANISASGKAEPEGGDADEVGRIMAVPAVAAKIEAAKSATSDGADRYIPRLLRMCYNTSLSPEEIAEGQGTTGSKTLYRIRSAARALTGVRLLIEEPEGRLRVNQEELDRLSVLSRAVFVPATGR